MDKKHPNHSVARQPSSQKMYEIERNSPPNITLTKFRSISLVYVLRCSSSWFWTGRWAGTLFHWVSQLAGLVGFAGFPVESEEVSVCWLGAGAGEEAESEGWEWCRS